MPVSAFLGHIKNMFLKNLKKLLALNSGPD